ncbi:MAG TPA: HAMP domain-containing histidine kinase [Oscillatoriales cyanobacterium M59_W2019_021]|nr:HAMP domain-containing histidine kinase [Oscillatoriales cyanobacterium M4454_W2019_049]HIK52794.1 HAMP domain-containing histidine kinase [Oscillatoriales cyanobacterium M59_W2019_021]
MQARPIEFLPTVSEILTQVGADRILASHPVSTTPPVAAREAERQWQAGLSALTSLLHRIARDPEAMQPEYRQSTRSCGIILCGPQAIWSQTESNEHFITRLFSSGRSLAQLPGGISPDAPKTIELAMPDSGTIPLLGGDPLTGDRFCVVLTSEFSIALVLGIDRHGMPAFQFSFDPQAIATVWASLRSRVLLTHAAQLDALDALVCQFTPVAPHYKTVMRFSQLLLQSLPEAVPAETVRPLPGQSTANPSRRPAKTETPTPAPAPDPAKMCDDREETPPDVELLQALAHEVRTPLSTIRTFTRLLLKRRNLDPDAVKWLETIDRECSEQIDRFGLIFRAVELETSSVKKSPLHLTRTSLEQAISHCIPRWQKQACRRGLKLEVSLPQTMPQVVSDPTMIDQVLSGAIDNFTSGLPAGSHVTVKVLLAGHQLKLQLKSEPPNPEISVHSSPLKSIGQLLMFQPETGNLSLNLTVTKNLFQALGGKLVVRNRPHQGEELTIFFPLE